MQTFFFYDLETTGLNPRWHRVCQFAGVRTDTDLKPLAAPVSWLVQVPDEVVPDPDAALVTGLTPQRCADGITQEELFRRIESEFSQPGTCVAGYNSLRFDDEFVRFGLFRHLFDPYGREWRGGNSRWDLIDLARMTRALRPDGLHWPQRDDGQPDFRLERLAQSNELEQARAHDALSDVHATVALARLLRSAQPRLYDYYLSLRDKRRVADLLLPLGQAPLVHVSGRYGAARDCLAMVASVAQHPVNRNSVIVVDLTADLEVLFELDARALRAHLYGIEAELGGAERLRIPLKEVHLNRVPAVAPAGVVRAEDAERLGIDLQRCEAMLARVQGDRALSDRIAQVYQPADRAPTPDVDGSLYDGFLPDADRDALGHVRAGDHADLSRPGVFTDPRALELAEHHLARSHSEALEPAAAERWRSYVRHRLHEGRDGMLSLEQARARIAELRHEGAQPDVLDELEAHLAALAQRWPRAAAAS